MKYFTNIADVRQWRPDPNVEGEPLDIPNIPIQPRPETENRDPFKLLVCHDFKGAYLPYEGSQGILTEETVYTLEYLHLVSTFVYFSHHRVTIPPASWTNLMHKNGVRILGTFIVEPGNTTGFDDLLEEDSSGNFIFVDKLAGLAKYYGFDGWLLNFESEFNPFRFNLQKTIKFVADLKKECARRIGGHSEVSWYDSLTIYNKVHWANGLSAANAPFFGAASTLFTNYCWQPSNQLILSAFLSKGMGRNHDVYMGIDVFGRGSFGGGQWGVGTALAVIRPAQLSAAIFAPGWVFENFDGLNFNARNKKFWIDSDAADKELICRPVAEFAPSWEAGTSQFFYTNFNRAYGKKWFQLGREVSSRPWAHLGAQSVLPTYYSIDTDRLVWNLDDEIVYDGAYSLKVSYRTDIGSVDSKVGSCKLYKLRIDYKPELRLSLSYILGPENKGRVCLYFLLERFNGVVERHEVGLPVQEGWGVKVVTLDVGRPAEEWFGMKLVEIGIGYIIKKDLNKSAEDDTQVPHDILRIGHICLSGYPEQRLPGIKKVLTTRRESQKVELSWTLDYTGFSQAEISQEGVLSTTTGEFQYFVVYRGLGEWRGISHCLKFLASEECSENEVYRVDGVAFDGRVVKGAWF